MEIQILPPLIALLVGGTIAWAMAWGLARARANAEIARLETTLEMEREASREKLHLLEHAQTELSNAFKALSSEALQSNNASFLHLAKATLERFQETARGDLERR